MFDVYFFDVYFKFNCIRIKHVYIEKAHPMSQQGVCSTFTYAHHCGEIMGILIANEIPHTLIPPQEWQKVMFLGTKPNAGKAKRDPKARALEAANRVFAKKNSFWLRSPRCKKPHDGMVDAALLAEACRRATR
jgi:hypothetical protein